MFLWPETLSFTTFTPLFGAEERQEEHKKIANKKKACLWSPIE
jgi:hypothetical protein